MILLTNSALVLLIALAVLISIAWVAFIIFYVNKKLPEKHKSKSLDSQSTLADHELLLLIQSQPDGLLSAEQLSKITGIKKSKCSKRLYFLYHKKILKINFSGMRRYFELTEPIVEQPQPTLSSEPFFSLSDLLILFKHHDFRLNLVDICLATRLPIAVILDELKYFEKKKIIRIVRDLMNHNHWYVLEEPYRNDPDKFLKEEADVIDLDLSRIYEQVAKD